MKYMDFLYGNGYLDLESCPAAEETALADVTYGELAGWANAALESAQGTDGALTAESGLSRYAAPKDPAQGGFQGKFLGIL